MKNAIFFIQKLYRDSRLYKIYKYKSFDHEKGSFKHLAQKIYLTRIIFQFEFPFMCVAYLVSPFLSFFPYEKKNTCMLCIIYFSFKSMSKCKKKFSLTLGFEIFKLKKKERVKKLSIYDFFLFVQGFSKIKYLVVKIRNLIILPFCILYLQTKLSRNSNSE